MTEGDHLFSEEQKWDSVKEHNEHVSLKRKPASSHVPLL